MDLAGDIGHGKLLIDANTDDVDGSAAITPS
jgi:hypothetical protein